MFPIQERATLEQLKELEEENTVPAVIENEPLDTKIFQRKRKIDIDVVNAQNKPKEIKISNTDEQSGFGFKTNSIYTDYLGFKSGGVMFGKNEEKTVTEDENSKQNVEFEETKNTLCEKLAFLSEGHTPVSPVQTMMIQIEVN